MNELFLFVIAIIYLAINPLYSTKEKLFHREPENRMKLR